MSKLKKKPLGFEPVIRSAHSLTVKGMGYSLVVFMLLVMTSCGRDEDTVLIIDQEEFSAEERYSMSVHIGEAIEDNAAFTVINPKATVDIDSFYVYLDRIYQSLVNTAQVTNRNSWKWAIKILKDDASKNTFITPGGTMYITTGMLKTIRTEHELISILAHEISYADGDVLLGKIKEEYGGDVLFEVVNGINPPELPVIAEELQNMTYSEEEVVYADRFAVGVICDFLYDPHGMRDFLKRVIENEEENLDWLDNRIGTADRAMLIEQNASGCGPGGTFESRYQEYVLKLP
jgi:beta-barrel assembly-enhancing protease